MYPVRKPTITHLGLATCHDQSCAVLPDEHAVYNCNTGIFHPSWKAQIQGYHLVHADSKFKKLLIKWFFKDSSV